MHKIGLWETAEIIHEVKLLHVCKKKRKKLLEELLLLRLLILCHWILIFDSLSMVCRHFCREQWMTIEARDMIPNQVVWRFVWFKARMTFAIHKLNSKLKNTTKWVICGGAAYLIMLIWYNYQMLVTFFYKMKMWFHTLSLHKQKDCCWWKTDCWSVKRKGRKIKEKQFCLTEKDNWHNCFVNWRCHYK